MTESRAAITGPVDSAQAEPLELRRSALEDIAAELAAAEVTGDHGVSIREIPFATQIGLRITPGSPAVTIVEAFWGLALPETAGKTTGDPDAASLIWLSPDEFLYVDVSRFRGLAEAQQAQDALGDNPGQIVDLSANRSIIELAGPQARAVLEKSSHIDLHPREFPVGAAVSTALGPVQIILHRSADQSFRIYSRASFAQYLARWLMDGMQEFAHLG